MINIRVRAFHMDHLPRCEHGRVLCKACGFDPFEGTPSHQPGTDLPEADGGEGSGFIVHQGRASK
jgi:hypothetical protein